MIEGRRVIVVVPAYEEEALIGSTLESIPEEVDHIIVVDDASPDRTADTVAEVDDPRIELIRHQANGGVGAAIATGYRAFLDGRATDDDRSICVVMAGDAQMDPKDLPALLHPILHLGAGYAKGNRLATHDVRDVMPRTRFLGNVVFSMFTKMASGYWHVVDSQCGYTAITREALARLDLGSVYPRYGFPNDLLVKLNVAGVKVADVPVRAIYGEERSGIRPGRVLPRIVWLLCRGFWWRLWRRHVVNDFHPFVLLYLFGFLLSMLGIGMAIWISALRIGTGLPPTSATSVLTALFILTGFQSILFAMMFDMLHNNDLKVVP